MEHTHPDRRLAPRFPLKAKVTVLRKSGETLSAIAVDISSSGMLLQVEQPFFLRLGEEVTVEVDLPDDSDEPFSAWGIGRVVRLDPSRSAIQLDAGSFEDLRSHPDGDVPLRARS